MVILALGAFLALVGCRTTAPIGFLEGGEPMIQTGRVVFAGPDGNLYATGPGESLIRLTDVGNGRSSMTITGAYAWAGSRIVYATRTLNTSNDQVTGAIYSVEPGHTPRKLVRRKGLNPFFLYPSPDASRVAYLGSVRGQDGFEMGSVSSRGRGDVSHGIGQPFFAAWSPDSTTLLTHVGAPAGQVGSSIQAQSLDLLLSGKELAPALGLQTGLFQAPAYSPNGEGISLVLRDGEDSTLAILDTSSTRILPIARLEGFAALAWSPNGYEIAYIDGRASPTGGVVGPLWIADPEGQTRKLVSERATAFFFSPDGTRLLFMEPYFINDGGNRALVYRIGLHSSSLPEPEYLAAMRPANAFVSQIVPFIDQYLRAYTIWSPDSRLVVLNSTASNGEPIVHLLDTERRRAASEFNVSFTVQSTLESGLVPESGVDSRVLSFGTNPFFSPGNAGINLQVQALSETDS